MTQAVAATSGRTAPSREQMVALDSLRGVCACIVVLYHLRTTGTITNLAFVRGGWLFVDFFFVLSGFVITAAYGARLREGFEVRRFMLLRLGRIYPIHLLVLGAFVAMECVALLAGTGGLTARAAFGEGRSLPELLGNLLLLQSLGVYDRLTWNGPSWSISAEIWTYLLAALALKARTATAAMLVVAAVLGSAIFLAATGGGDLDRSYDLGIVRCIYGFGLGMIGFLLFGRGEPGSLPRPSATAAEAALAGSCVVLVSLVHAGPLTLLAPPLFAAAVVVFARASGLLSLLLGLRPFVLIGTWSYSIYMVHVLVEGRFIDLLRIVADRLGIPFTAAIGPGSMKIVGAPAPWADVAAITALLLVIGVAWISYTFVEKPCREWSRAYARRLHVARAEAVSPAL